MTGSLATCGGMGIEPFRNLMWLGGNVGGGGVAGGVGLSWFINAARIKGSLDI